MTTPAAPHANPTAGRKRPVVLFIEDNQTQLDLYAMLIEHELAVVKASRGLTGFELAIAERPDVIVLDLLLPDIDGFALAVRLRTTPATASIPIVVLTGHDAAFARAQASARFSDVLLKPCPADRLLQSIHQARRGRST
jgi:CheY-like chemotaxis protein